jgi:iron-only hydrogenase group A
MIHIKINNNKLIVKPGETILEVALKNNIKIPFLSYHPDLKNKGGDRISLIEIKGERKLQAADSTLVREGMEILTESEKVRKMRRLNIELLFASHIEKCADCTLRFNCGLLNLARDYNIKITEFTDRKYNRKTYKFSNAVEIDGSQCIDCGNCIEACALQGIEFLHFDGNGYKQEVKPVADKNKACIYCGQCTNVCPVAAAQEQTQWLEVEKALENKDNIMVAQFAPAVRVSLGEEFGLPYGTNCAKKINTALKKIGFSYVFDINFGADITTMVEAEELLERLDSKKAILPMMTSCCPSWVAYVEFYHPELIPCLTTSRSPHIHSAGAIKSYFAKKNKLSDKKIKILSIVPCTAKKHEAGRKELFYKNRRLVDYVLTVREFAFMLKKQGIDLATLKDSETNSLFNDGSGAAAIYGTSGGVMESALRSAVVLYNKNKKERTILPKLEFKEVRGLKGIKEATVNLGRKKLKVAVVSGIGNFPKIITKLKNYHYIEVMACPGGCLGGGGQPFPTTFEIKKRRSQGLYKIDLDKKMRRAHENQVMLNYYKWVKDKKMTTKLIHTKFFAKRKK